MKMCRLVFVNLFVVLAAAIWPVPIQYSLGNTTVVLANDFSIEFNAPSGTLPAGCVDTSQTVLNAINRTYDLLNDGFIPDMLFQFQENFEPTESEMASAQVIHKLIVTQRYVFHGKRFIVAPGIIRRLRRRRK